MSAAVRGWLRRPSCLVLLSAVALAALAMFTLAWLVPSAGGPVVSVSYAVGYNNLVAWAGLFVACGVAWLAGRLALRDGTPPADEAAEDAPSGPPGTGGEALPKGDVIALAATTGIAFTAFAYSTFGIPVFDNIFFFDRIAQTLGGAVPWRDFYFPYGPLMLYVPAGLCLLLSRMGAPAVLGYYVALGVSHVAGVWLLGWVIGRMPLARARKRTVFWILGLSALFAVFGGLNYTLLRFLAPAASVLLLAGWAARDRRPSPFLLGAASVGLAGLNLAISPELGLAFAAASLGVLVAPAEATALRRYAGPAVAVAGLAAIVGVAGATVSSALAPLAGGAYRLPVLPSPYILVFAGSAIFASFALGMRRMSFAGPAPVAAVFIVGLMMAPSALARADFGHVFWNGLPLIITAAVLLRPLPARRFAAWAAVLALVFPAWAAVNAYVSARTIFNGAVVAGRLPRDSVIALGRVVARDASDIGDAYDAHAAARLEGALLERFMRLDDVAMPFGADDTLGFEYAARRRLVPVMSDENGPVDGAQFTVVADQLERARWLLIPIDTANAVSRRVVAGDVPLSRMPAYRGSYESTILQFPVNLTLRRKLYDGRYTLGLEIERTFEPVETAGRYVILERRR